MRTVATGVERMDELLGGGVAPKSTTLLQGPPFSGKQTLAYLFGLTGVRQGEPAIFVTTDASAGETSRRLAQIDDDIPSYESEGLIRYVDAYSEAVGGEEAHPGTAYVESAVNLNAFTRVMNEIQRQILETQETHRMVFDSLTTMIVNTNAQTAFRFLQVFLGRTRQAGGTSFLLLESGIHQDQEVQLIKHLCDGVVQIAVDDDLHTLRLEGFSLNESPGWVEYNATGSSFEIVGSFGAGRIH